MLGIIFRSKVEAVLINAIESDAKGDWEKGEDEVEGQLPVVNWKISH